MAAVGVALRASTISAAARGPRGLYAVCESILDVGCGEGLFTHRLIGLSRRVVGIDVLGWSCLIALV